MNISDREIHIINNSNACDGCMYNKKAIEGLEFMSRPEDMWRPDTVGYLQAGSSKLPRYRSVFDIKRPEQRSGSEGDDSAIHFHGNGLSSKEDTQEFFFEAAIIIAIICFLAALTVPAVLYSMKYFSTML